MSRESNDLMRRNGVFIWIGFATSMLLLIPLVAMQFTSAVNWDATDFVVMGMLLFGTASLFVLVARKVPRNRRLLIGVMCAAVFLYLWAELAVGLFTSWGS